MYPELTWKHCFLCILGCYTVRKYDLKTNIRMETKNATDEQVIAAAKLANVDKLRKNCRMDGIPISGKTAVNCPEESASGFPLQGLF